VERVLAEHPSVAEAAVIGKPDAKWQEVPVAYVVRRPGARTSAEEIMRYVGEQLARFKVPREVVFVEALPRNALGKVQHFVLRQKMNQR
jgi:fatty-acyl-CoA synthase